MTETLAHGYSSKSTQRELSNEYQHDMVEKLFKKSLHPCALDESSLTKGSIGRVNKLYIQRKRHVRGVQELIRSPGYINPYKMMQKK